MNPVVPVRMRVSCDLGKREAVVSVPRTMGAHLVQDGLADPIEEYEVRVQVDPEDFLIGQGE